MDKRIFLTTLGELGLLEEMLANGSMLEWGTTSVEEAKLHGTCGKDTTTLPWWWLGMKTFLLNGEQ